MAKLGRKWALDFLDLKEFICSIHTTLKTEHQKHKKTQETIEEIVNLKLPR